MQKFSYLSIPLFFIFFFSCCKAHISDNKEHSFRYHFLSINDGAALITEDKTEGFFDHIQPLDMSIQLGYDCGNRTQCLSAYKTQLKSEVMDFTETDKKILSEVMDSALYLTDVLNSHMLDHPIALIKVKGDHYGPSVYYTRDNGIVIPQDVLQSPNFSNLLATMLHEIAHIVSRYQPRYKKELYPLIGFTKNVDNYILPDAVQNRMLLNPDGLNTQFSITLTNGTESINAVPIIVSNLASFSDKKKGFFTYLKFDLYEVKDRKVISQENGFSSLSPGFMPSFFNQIKDNTQYIIHPDEIMADNFMHLAMAKGLPTPSEFSKEGLALLMDIKRIIKTL